MQLTSINIGKAETIQGPRRQETSGIFKRPVPGPLRVTALGLEGDFIASTKHHGGPDQAVYVYGGADYDWWATQLGRELDPGTFGENLTVGGLESARFAIGDRLRLAEVLLEVTAPRIPCETFAARMGDAQFVKKFRRAERPGLYCRVLREGLVKVGEEVTLEACAGEKVLLLEIYRDYYEKKADAAELQRFLRAPVAIRARRDLEKRLASMKG
jgi:MOSC domain-containing protein YiiM